MTPPALIAGETNSKLFRVDLWFSFSNIHTTISSNPTNGGWNTARNIV